MLSIAYRELCPYTKKSPTCWVYKAHWVFCMTWSPLWKIWNPIQPIQQNCNNNVSADGKKPIPITLPKQRDFRNKSICNLTWLHAYSRRLHWARLMLELSRSSAVDLLKHWLRWAGGADRLPWPHVSAAPGFPSRSTRSQALPSLGFNSLLHRGGPGPNLAHHITAEIKEDNALMKMIRNSVLNPSGSWHIPIP